MSILQFRDKRQVPSTTASIYHHNPLLILERQSKYIQQNLQTLIDAQSEGLLAGLSQSGVDDTSEGSCTPTSSRTQSSSVVWYPKPKKIGLRSARKGIFQSIYELLKVKEQERDILSSQAEERNTALHEIEGFNSRRSGLEDAIYSIQHEGGNQYAKQLLEEAQVLETDIQNLETKLYELKAKHAHLVREASKIENTVEAKLSSYTDSLSLLQSEIQTYLRHPPVQPLSRRTSNSNESTFYSLNPKRRTLEMARDHWKDEQETLKDKQRVVDAEILALEEGGGVWKQTIADVNGFEKRLGGYMQRFTQLNIQATEGEGIERMKDDATSIKLDLEQTTQRLEANLRLAEDKDWKLLVCCIAAELEALREARGILLSAFGISVTEEEDQDGQRNDESTDPRRQSSETDDLEPPADLLKDRDDHNDTASRSEDDEPDPAWLLPDV